MAQCSRLEMTSVSVIVQHHTRRPQRQVLSSGTVLNSLWLCLPLANSIFEHTVPGGIQKPQPKSPRYVAGRGSCLDSALCSPVAPRWLKVGPVFSSWKRFKRAEKEGWIKAKYVEGRFLNPDFAMTQLAQVIAKAIEDDNVAAGLEAIAHCSSQSINAPVASGASPLHVACGKGSVFWTQFLIWVKMGHSFSYFLCMCVIP